MTEETINIIQIVAPAITSAAGALLAVKMAYSRIREDITELGVEVSELKDQFASQAVQNTRDHGEVMARVKVLAERIDNMRSPWQKST